MKVLKIEDGGGYFYHPDIDDWKPIDEIDKEELMILLNLYLEKDVEIDVYEENHINNQAQKIIYKSISEKFLSLNENRSRFSDESERKYLEAIQEYSE